MTATAALVKALYQITPHERVKTRPVGRGIGRYVDARYVMDALDEGVGPESWQTKFEDVPGGVRCGIGIDIEGMGWVWKWDASPWTDREPLKGGHSKALVRAAVHWGIARDLYEPEDEENRADDSSRHSASQSTARTGPPPVRAAARPSSDGPEFAPNEWDEPTPIRQSSGANWTFSALAKAAEDAGIAKTDIYRMSDKLFGKGTKVTELEPGQREQIAFELGLTG